jgi:hypothetical protein
MVSIRVTVKAPGGSFQTWAKGNAAVAREAVTAGITKATRGALLDMRQQMTAAGLGRRLPNALRSTVYTDAGRNRDEVKGLIQPKDGQATSIFSAFTEGVTIRGRNGNWLAIPSDNVPLVGGKKGGRRRMTPQQMEESFNGDLVLLPTRRPNVLQLYARVVQSSNKKGYRRGTVKRLAQGRLVKLVLMFTLVRQVGLRARLAPAPIAEKWAARAPFLINQSFSQQD